MRQRQEDPMIQIRRILCPTDFSDFSRRALEHAVALARWYDADLTLLHVLPFVPSTATFPPGVSPLDRPGGEGFAHAAPRRRVVAGRRGAGALRDPRVALSRPDDPGPLSAPSCSIGQCARAAPERSKPLPGDELIPEAIRSTMHAITIRCDRRVLWPWLVMVYPRRR
jgi:hypothetical protein